MKKIILLLVLPYYAFASEPVVKLGSGDWLQPYEKMFNADYQMGPNWGKIPHSEEAMQDPVYARATRATAKLGGGTAFYLGKFAGEHVIATNHHVCPASWRCMGIAANFTVLNKQFETTSFVGTWKNIDLSLLTIKVDPDSEAVLESVAANFAFDIPLYVGQPLLTAGYGVANNPKRELMVNQDAECEVFSSEVRYMPDPDDFNTGPDLVWSFANACDVSHGDSGSAIVDRNTGHVLGLIWTGRIPKDPIVREEAYLRRIQEEQAEDIWKQLSYAVPAAKIREFLHETAEEEDTSLSRKQILRAVIGF